VSRTPQAILLVDDESAVRRVLEVALTRAGVRVLPAADGSQAANLYREHHQDVGLALLDVQMPGGNGPEVLETLRAINPDVRACFMSGQSATYSAEQLLRLGALQVFEKPFEDLSAFADNLRQLAAG
jgi:CheY-like chemotaxis protein